MIPDISDAMNDTWIAEMNHLGRQRKSFFFVIDFEMQHPVVQPLSEIDSNSICFRFRDHGNFCSHSLNRNITLNPSFVSSLNYSKGFAHVQDEQRRGNSVLANLTCPTELSLNYLDAGATDGAGSADRASPLRQYLPFLNAPYVLWMKPHLLTKSSEAPKDIRLPTEILVFSPETFVRTFRNKIYTFPIKGSAVFTGGGTVDDAKRALLNNEKEHAEHITVVDLLRNDLGRVGSNIAVEEFRAVSLIQLYGKKLLQVSSRIRADLPPNWKDHIGDIFAELLPAGSVSGAPKRETCRIIRDAEAKITTDSLLAPRNYYCGVAGIFDGKELESTVLIRFIEARQQLGGLQPEAVQADARQQPGAAQADARQQLGAAQADARQPGVAQADARQQLGARQPLRYFFRSGGGITVYSNEKEEYEELKNKISLPVFPHIRGGG